MKILKRVLIVLSSAFLVIQFIRPPKNISGENSADVSTRFSVPSDVAEILRTSCYDCHSNRTRYPWYAEVQPAGWWLNSHITDGKRQLNFSEFTARPLRWQFHRFENIVEQVDKDEMPLPSYLIIHTDAKLSPPQKDRLITWANAMRDSMQAHYPADSLRRRR
jgi:hypothetical protein